METIILKGREVLLDSRDLSLYESRVWYISDGGYVVWRGIDIDGKKKTIRLHRVIINAKDDEIVDHINRNKLDNRRSNLRIVTNKQNIHNSDRYEMAKGYYYDNNKKRWAVDSKRYGIKSLYVDSEKDAKSYVEHLKSGIKPKRVFTRRVSLGGAKLTPSQRKEAHEMFKNGIKRHKIAQHLGVSSSAVGRLLSGKTWNNKVKGE